MARKKNRDQSEPIDPAQLRLREPLRDQVTPVPAWLDHLLPEDHVARLIWAATGLLDLTLFFEGLVVTKEGPGRAAASPRLLVALWLYAFSQGVNSARELCRLCVRDLAYLWLCGGVTMNYHSLSDFRVGHAAALEQLMVDVLGRLLHAGLVQMEHGAQDGVRVRASAGAASFRRQPSLEKCLQQAQALVAALPAAEEGPDDHDDADPPSGGQRAARERAARERLARVEAALAELPEVRARAAKHGPKERHEARVSTTDPEARVMKMPDGGFRPAYNVQFTVDSAHCVVIGARVTNGGSDMNQMPPMVKQVRQGCGQLPKNWLMDGGFPSVEAIKLGAAEGMCVLAPVPAPRNEAQDRYAPRPGDAPAVAAWRQRMATKEAKELYKLRAATVEWFNAQARERYGLQRLRVRGLLKVGCIALWTAITHNLLIWIRHLGQRLLAPVGAAA